MSDIHAIGPLALAALSTLIRLCPPLVAGKSGLRVHAQSHHVRALARRELNNVGRGP
jgi:hypothetical protein